MIGISQISSPDDPFLEILRSRNEESVSQIKQLLCNGLESIDSSKCCIFLTGSDGRKEKTLHSPYEMIVVFKANISCESKDRITTRIKEIAARNLSNFDQEIEFKELDSESVLLCKG